MARELFKSRITTVLTMVGVAVGLGNVWRFPYMMGQFGGSAFLIVYLVFVVAFALPALTAEWALGRHARRGPLGAFTLAFGPRGKWIGFLLLATVFIANSYYVVIVGNVTYTAMFGLGVGFSSDNLPAYQTGLEAGRLQAAFALVVIGLAMIVLYRGLTKGIERISTLFVPAFGIVVLVLIVNALALPGAVGALRGFLSPDFGALTVTSIFAAMGQAFFSLSLGGTFYLIYGSYLRDEERIPTSAAATAVGDVSAALLAALFIVPATLALGIDLETGPLLIFETLPQMFGVIPAGRWWGGLFLIALWMVAFLSTVAAFQVVVGALTDAARLSRGVAVLIVGGAEALIMLPSALKPEIIGTLDLIFGSGMQVLGSGLTIVALFWGCGYAVASRQIFGPSPTTGQQRFLWWLRWAVPGALSVVLVSYVVNAAS